jgi:hypothetical protein
VRAKQKRLHRRIAARQRRLLAEQTRETEREKAAKREAAIAAGRRVKPLPVKLRSDGRPVAESPSPPAHSPTTTREKPTLGCSARHASTSLSSAALLTAYAPSRPWWCQRGTDRRQVRGGTSGCRKMRDRRARDERRADDVGVERSPPRLRVRVDEPDQGPDPGGVDEGVDSSEPGGRLGDRRPAGGFVGDVALDRQRRGARLLRSVVESPAPPREERHMSPPLGKADSNATPESARGAYDDCSQSGHPLKMTQLSRAELGDSRRRSGWVRWSKRSVTLLLENCRSGRRQKGSRVAKLLG